MDSMLLASYAAALPIRTCMPAFRSSLLSLALVAVLTAAVAAETPPAASAPADNLRLPDTRWLLKTLEGGPVAAAENGKPLLLVLQARSQHLSAYAGCNPIRGRYTQRGTQLALKTLASTRMACAPEAMSQEQRFLRALAAIDGYRIEGRTLSLLQGEVVKATFSATR